MKRDVGVTRRTVSADTGGRETGPNMRKQAAAAPRLVSVNHRVASSSLAWGAWERGRSAHRVALFLSGRDVGVSAALTRAVQDPRAARGSDGVAAAGGWRVSARRVGSGSSCTATPLGLGRHLDGRAPFPSDQNGSGGSAHIGVPSVHDRESATHRRRVHRGDRRGRHGRPRSTPRAVRRGRCAQPYPDHLRRGCPVTTADLIAYAAALLAAAVITWRTVRRWRDQAESARVVRRRLGLDA